MMISRFNVKVKTDLQHAYLVLWLNTVQKEISSFVQSPTYSLSLTLSDTHTHTHTLDKVITVICP